MKQANLLGHYRRAHRQNRDEPVAGASNIQSKTIRASNVNPANSSRANRFEAHGQPIPTKIAEWLIDQIHANGKLTHVNAVAAIQNKFGLEHVSETKTGAFSIDRRILYQFWKLSGDDIVWVTCQGGGYWPGAHWRRREPGDSSDRTQFLTIDLNEESSMSANSFRPRKFEDFEIVDTETKVVGHIRVKPSGVLWAPANGKLWFGVSLKDFALFMEREGKKQKK